MLKETGFTSFHRQLGAKMAAFAGYDMPIVYSSIKEEHLMVRNDAGLFDVSHMGEFFIEGAQALDLLQYLCSNDASKLYPNRAQYSCLTNEQGGIVDDLIVYCINPDQYLMVVNAANIEKDLAWIQQHNRFDARVSDLSNQMGLLAIQGPAAVQLLQPFTDIDLSAIAYYHFAIGDFAGLPNILISATGYTGAGGFELYFQEQQAAQLWQALQTANGGKGIQPIGLAARDTLRLEMGYCLYGNDIDDHTSPLEAGLGWITKFNKDFIGKEILMQQKAQGVRRKLVGLEMLEGGAIPRQGYTVLDAQCNAIGKVTSGTQSPSLDKAIALAYIEPPHTETNTEVWVQVRNKEIAAKVTAVPFLKK